jgi:hypothetical protein
MIAKNRHDMSANDMAIPSAPSIKLYELTIAAT